MSYHKATTDSCPAIEMSYLRKSGYFKGHVMGNTVWTGDRGILFRVRLTVNTGASPFARFSYALNGSDGNSEDFDYSVGLTSTPCHFGGRRWWFACPLIRDGTPCRRRVAVLYLRGGYFGCRQCHGLAYKSCLEPHTGRKGERTKQINMAYPRPGMCWNTRTRFWKGKPTKRYARFLSRWRKLSSIVGRIYYEKR